MADRPALVMVQHAIAKPDEAWPVIHEQLFDVLFKLAPDHVRLTLQSPQEVVVMERLAPFYLVRMQLQTLKAIQSSWNYRWLDHLFQVTTQYRVGCDWFPTTGRRPNLDAWFLEDCVGLIVVRTNYQPEIFSSTINHALAVGVPVVRIDPESHQVVKMKPPTKEEPPDG